MSDIASLPALRTENWEWQIDAACRGLDVEIFFHPDFERGVAKRRREVAAKAICMECPVIGLCLDWALSVGEPYGIWGGKSPREREMLRTASQAS